MLRIAYRHKMNQSALAFLFSADNLNDAFRRWQYLRQYDSFRERQAELITETREMLLKKTEQLDQQRMEKENLLSSEQQQRNLLDKELKDKDKLLDNLESNEKRMVADLEKHSRAHEELNAAIEENNRE